MKNAFIISGNRTADKREELSIEIYKQTGIFNINIVPGVYSEGLSINNIAMAHKKIVRLAKMKGYDFCLIMEDDVEFPVPIKSFEYFIDGMKKLPKDWDIYTSGFYTTNSFMQDFENIYRISGFAGLHLYCVNSRFYDTFLNTPMGCNIDQWISTAGISNCYCCYPFAAYQKDGYSENVGRETAYSTLLMDKKIYPNF